MKFKDALLILSFAVIVFLYFKGCGDGEKTETIKYDTTYIPQTDTLWRDLPPKLVPVPYKVEIPGTPGATITIPSIIDTIALLEDYFTKRHYQDSVKTDSIEIHWSASVYKNQLYTHSLRYRWLAPTMLITKTVTQEKQLLFIGADLVGNSDHFGIYPSVYFDTKKAMIGAGYDPLNKMFKVGLYGKLRLWKKK